MIWLILLGITAQAIGYLFISLSLPRLPAVVTSIILLAQPVVAVGLAMVILSEAPSAGQLLGVACVIGGIAFATVPLSRLRRRPPECAADGTTAARPWLPTFRRSDVWSRTRVMPDRCARLPLGPTHSDCPTALGSHILANN